MLNILSGATLLLDVPVFKENGYSASTTFSVTVPANSGITATVTPSSTSGTTGLTVRLAITAAAGAATGSVNLTLTGSPAPAAPLVISLGINGGGGTGGGEANFTQKSVNGFGYYEFASTADGAEYTWDFGDGSAPATGRSVSHGYPDGLPVGPRSYTVKHTVKSASGATSTTQQTATYSSTVGLNPAPVRFLLTVAVPQALFDQVTADTLRMRIYPNPALRTIQALKPLREGDNGGDSLPYVDGLTAFGGSETRKGYGKSMVAGSNPAHLALYRVTNLQYSPYINWTGYETADGASVLETQGMFLGFHLHELVGSTVEVTGRLKSPPNGADPDFTATAVLQLQNDPAVTEGQVLAFTLGVSGTETYEVYMGGSPETRMRPAATLTKA